MLLGRDKLDFIEVIIPKTLINSYINHEEFISVNEKHLASVVRKIV